MQHRALVIHDARQLAQIVRFGSILRLSQQELLLQSEAALYPLDALKRIISQEKIRSMDQLQTFSWYFSLQSSLSGPTCRISSHFYDRRDDRQFVRLRVYSRAAALCRSGTPRLEDICRTAMLDIPYRTTGTNPHCVSSALREGGGVCQAIALYVCQLLLRCGYPCVVRTGTVNGEPHAWNQALVNGQWTRLDLCVNGPAIYQDTTSSPPPAQYADMCDNVSREVVLLEHEATVGGLKIPFYLADRRFICPTRFVQCFNGAYTLENGHMLLCLGPSVRRIPLSYLQETPDHLPYMDVQQFARLMQIQYTDNRLIFNEGL